MTKEDQAKKLGQIIAKAWADVTFKERLLADATAVLREEEVSVPEGVEIKAVENAESLIHIVIPQ